MKAKSRYFGLALLSMASIAYAGGQGKLSVETTPKALIYVDGNPIRKAPLKGLVVTTGHHHVKYENKEQGQSVEFEISISADKHMKCSYDFGNGEHRCAEEKMKTAKAAAPKPAKQEPAPADSATPAPTPTEP